MNNKLGIYNLFGENTKAKREFANWCKDNNEICEYDYEKIELDLYLPTLDNTDKYYHFHKGNILDWLESVGYYIGFPLRGKFKYVTVVHYRDSVSVNKKPIYSNSGVVSRNRALDLGVTRAINNYEKRLNDEK